MRGDQRFAQASQVGQCVFVNNQLIGVGASLMSDCNRFPTPDQFCATDTKALPAPKGVLAGATLCATIPAFHRQNGEAIANGLEFVRKRLRQGR